MIDVHCHINFHKFETDFDEVIKRALEKGVTRIINIGTKLDSSQHAIDLADQYEELYAIVGVHPHHADKMEPLLLRHSEQREESPEEILNQAFRPSGIQDDNKSTNNASASHQHDSKTDEALPHDWIEQLEQMTKHPKVIGIGECGMDFYEYQSNGIVDPKVQEEAFVSQIELSHRSGLPLQIHNRQAGEKVIEILTHHKNSLQDVPGMFHCFAGSEAVLKAALDMGFYIGFDGNVTYKGIAKGETTELSDIARLVPLDRMVVETDSPYLTPHPHRGTRNEPAYVIIVAEYLAQLKSISYHDLVAQTDKNVYTLFSKLK